jgi:hypothetical protein
MDAIGPAEVDVAGERVHLQRLAVGSEQPEGNGVVGQDPLGHAREVREYLPDVERAGQQRQQLGERIEALEQVGVVGHGSDDTATGIPNCRFRTPTTDFRTRTPPGPTEHASATTRQMCVEGNRK